MDYNAHMIARAEHNLMVHSLPTVSEFGEPTVARQPHGLSQLAGRLFSALGNGLGSLGQHFKQGQEITVIDRDQVTN